MAAITSRYESGKELVLPEAVPEGDVAEAVVVIELWFVVLLGAVAVAPVDMVDLLDVGLVDAVEELVGVDEDYITTDDVVVELELYTADSGRRCVTSRRSSTQRTVLYKRVCARGSCLNCRSRDRRPREKGGEGE